MQEHTAQIDALVIHCIDYRFVNLTKDYLAKTNLKYDLITYPGASKSIYLLFDAIAVSVNLHMPKKIMLIDHEDCGAFGVENSPRDHSKSLKRAKELTKVMYPSLPVETYIAKFTGVEELN